MLKFSKSSFFYTVLLLGCCVFYFFYSFKNYDIVPSDDYVYINNGIKMSLPLTNNYLGLFYPLFFKFMLMFGNFEHILTNVYITYYCLSIACFLFLYLYLKENKIHPTICFFVAASFLFSDYQIQLFPKISFFCFCIILMTLWLVRNKEIFIKIFAITILGWVLSYTRPEFFFTYILSFLTLLFLFFRNQKYKLKGNFIFIILPIILFFFGLYYLGGQPVSNRGLDAFVQHFVINYLSWYPDTQYEVGYRNEFTLFSKVYGNVNSMFQLLPVNPSLFFKHITYNTTHYFSLTINLLFNILSGVLINIFGGYTKYILMSFIILIPFIDLKKSLLNFKKNGIEFIIQNGLIILLVLFPTLVSVILIYPREHYLLFHLVIYFSFFALVLNSIVLKIKIISSILNPLIIILFFVGYSQKNILNLKQTYYKEMFEFLLKSTENRPLRVLSNEYFSTIFFKENLVKNKDSKLFFRFKNTTGLHSFLKANPVDYIYIGIQGVSSTNLEMNNFINHDYDTYGFRKMTPFKGVPYLIFIRKGFQ
jgi:hypothetical protein